MFQSQTCYLTLNARIIIFNVKVGLGNHFAPPAPSLPVFVCGFAGSAPAPGPLLAGGALCPASGALQACNE